MFCGRPDHQACTGLAGRLTTWNRQDGSWDESRQEVTTTICPYCGAGCNLELHVQDNRIVKVTSPLDHDVGHGHLCVKGRFGFEFVQRRAGEP
jgi:predicted molibdopterin-dependent oxidoreductase YjgC